MLRNQSDRAYDHLRQKLFNRELCAGEKLRYGPVGKEIGISATPVREAIGKLVGEGLVELVPQSGAIVASPSRQDAIEVFELREAIEPFAAAKACGLMGRSQLQLMGDTLAEMRGLHRKSIDAGLEFPSDPLQFDRADLRFHLTILEVADNRRMLKAVVDFHLLTAIIGIDRHGYETNVLAMTIEDHEAILDALNRRDADGVKAAMTLHIRNSRQLTLRNLTERSAGFETATGLL